MGKRKVSCDICEKEDILFRNIHIVNNVKYCRSCNIKRKKDRRKKLRQSIPPKPRPKKYKTKQKSIARKNTEKTGVSRTNIRFNPNQKQKINTYITWDERRLLFKSFIQQGYDEMEAKKRIREFMEYQNELGKKLRKLNKKEEEINQKFKEEFNKLILGNAKTMYQIESEENKTDESNNNGEI